MAAIKVEAKLNGVRRCNFQMVLPFSLFFFLHYFFYVLLGTCQIGM